MKIYECTQESLMMKKLCKKVQLQSRAILLCMKSIKKYQKHAETFINQNKREKKFLTAFYPI